MTETRNNNPNLEEKIMEKSTQLCADGIIRVTESPYKETNRGMRRHLLLTKEIENNIPKLYSQEKIEDPVVAVKFFSPYSNWTWYAIEGERTPDGDFRFFGLIDGHYPELGYFHLSELESIKTRFGVPAVERDCYFGTHRISEFK